MYNIQRFLKLWLPHGKITKIKKGITYINLKIESESKITNEMEKYYYIISLKDTIQKNYLK